MKKFRQAYQKWKENIKAQLDRKTNLNEHYMDFPKYMEEINYIRKEESKKLKNLLEKLYSAGYVPFLRTLINRRKKN